MIYIFTLDCLTFSFCSTAWIMIITSHLLEPFVQRMRTRSHESTRTHRALEHDHAIRALRSGPQHSHCISERRDCTVACRTDLANTSTHSEGGLPVHAERGLIMQLDDNVRVLNKLIEISEDRKRGLSGAIEDTTLPELRTTFHQRALNYTAAMDELQYLVGSFGGPPTNGRTNAGTAQRSLTGMKASADNSDLRILEEVERGEARTLAAYTRALAAKLYPQVRFVVLRQFDSTVGAHKIIRNLLDAQKVENRTLTGRRQSLTPKPINRPHDCLPLSSPMAGAQESHTFSTIRPQARQSLVPVCKEDRMLDQS